MATDKEVEIECKKIAQIDRAMLIDDGKQKVWIPLSQITDEGEDSIFVREWFAYEKGLI